MVEEDGCFEASNLREMNGKKGSWDIKEEGLDSLKDINLKDETSKPFKLLI